MKKQIIKLKGKIILDAGLILEVIFKTPMRVEAKIIDVFFPKHFTKSGIFQVVGDKAEFLREHLIGQTRKFWISGSRADMEVGGDLQVIDWDFKPSRIPELNTDGTFESTQDWFNEMQKRGLLFHPEDNPREIISNETNKELFTKAECCELDVILDNLFRYHGDPCEAALNAFNKGMK